MTQHFVLGVSVMMVAVARMTWAACAIDRWDCYHNDQELHDLLQHLHNKYPDKTHLYSIGKSVQGRSLWVLALSSRLPDRHEMLRPEVKLVANMHGDETVGRELLLRFAMYLLENPRLSMVRSIMNNVRLHLLPSLNPDGYARSREGSCMTSPTGARMNANGIDLNRDFPDKWKSSSGRNPQPETRAIMNWLQNGTFILSANFHGGAVVANYPYDSAQSLGRRYNRAPDDVTFRHLASMYASRNPPMFTGSACGGHFPGGITNGAEWYVVRGGMQDYNYVYHGVLALTLEVSCCKHASRHQLQQLWKDNKHSMLAFVAEANNGVRGVVTDSKSGSPVSATLKVVGREQAPFKTTKNGEFWRILTPGIYKISVEAPGYRTTTFSAKLSRYAPSVTQNVGLTKL